MFASMLLMSVAVAVWFGLRMPETLHPEHKRAFSLQRIGAGIVTTLSHRGTVGYGIAIALMMGCLMTYVSSSQQIFETEVYGLGAWFPAAFGGIAAVMGLAFFANSHLVRTLGMYRLSHVCLLLFVLFTGLGCVAAVLWHGKPPLLVFAGLLAAIQFLMCLTMPNFNAIAMEPLGAVAGTASSVLGLVTTLGGALIGMVVGRTFDGTVLPLGITYIVSGLIALLAVLWATRWRLNLSGAR